MTDEQMLAVIRDSLERFGENMDQVITFAIRAAAADLGRPITEHEALIAALVAGRALDHLAQTITLELRTAS